MDNGSGERRAQSIRQKAKEDEADTGWNRWTTSKHGKVEWSRFIGMPERDVQQSTEG